MTKKQKNNLTLAVEEFHVWRTGVDKQLNELRKALCVVTQCLAELCVVTAHEANYNPLIKVIADLQRRQGIHND